MNTIEQSMKDIKPGIYEHYKGKNYKVLGIAKHSETLEDVVVYECLYENELSQRWVRPLSMFCDEVEVGEVRVPRFRYLGRE